jgi:hypothetical protein
VECRPLYGLSAVAVWTAWAAAIERFSIFLADTWRVAVAERTPSGLSACNHAAASFACFQTSSKCFGTWWLLAVLFNLFGKRRRANTQLQPVQIFLRETGTLR